MEEALKKVNAKLVQLEENEIRTNNAILTKMLDDFKSEFETDAFFKSICKTCFFGGSFYDGLKVGQPNEFDIDFVIDLPQNANAKVIADDKNPEYVKVCLEHPPSCGEVKKFVDGRGYFSIKKIMSWFQRIVDRARVKMMEKKYKIISCKAPAVTIQIQVNDTIFDVDFVPCFKFGGDQWPSTSEEKGTALKEFFVVPKPKDNRDDLFRLSFQQQERDIIHNLGQLKPAIRLLKLLRDIYKDKIKSYYIKNLAMVALEKKAINVSNGKLSEVFRELFDYYVDVLDKGEMPYYWNNNLNLLEGKRGKQYYVDLINRLRKFQRVFRSENEGKIMKVFKMPYH